MATRFVSKSSAWKEAAVGPEAQAMVLAVAEKAQAIAEGLSTDFTKSGDYIESFHVRLDVVHEAGAERAAGILENTSDHAAAVEWGNAHDHRAHHVLGRTLGALHE